MENELEKLGSVIIKLDSSGVPESTTILLTHFQYGQRTLSL